MSTMSQRLQGHANRIRDGIHTGKVRWETMLAYAEEARKLVAEELARRTGAEVVHL